jgi:serine protease Do
MSFLSSSWSRKVAAVVALTTGVGIGAAVMAPLSSQPAAHAQTPVREVRQGSGSDALPAEVAQAEHLSNAFRKAANAVLPTVVTIETKSKPKARARTQRAVPPGMRENPFKGTPFEDFFGEDGVPFNQFGGEGSGRPQRMGSGSGVIIDASGVILTNNHVVEGADEVTVRLADDREFIATDIKTDPQTDLAVIRIKNAGTLPFARLGNSDSLEIGDWVIAIGNPFELDQTVSAGIISGKGRELRRGQRTRYLQTDAAINPGNSGGPLVNLMGEVVGINTAIASTSGGYQGIGFAIPSNLAKWIVGQLMTSGSVHRAYLGVGIEMLNGELAEKFGVERNRGVLVAEIFKDSPAAAAGFKEGDVITEFAGKPVRTPRDLQEVVEQSELNADQKVSIMRDGKPTTLTVRVKALPEKFGTTAATERREKDDSAKPGFQSDELGIEVTDLTADQAEKLGLGDHKGVVITDVKEDSVAAEAGLRAGMLVTRVGKDISHLKDVQTVDQFKAAMKDGSVKDGILLHVRTDEGARFIVVRGS